MTTAIIADDEPHLRAQLRDDLALLWPELGIVGEAEDGPSALALIETKQPDIAFLDIRMPGMTGLQVAHAMTAPSRVVFVTAFDAYALEAFDANAVDYVVKPVELPRLAKLAGKLKSAMRGSHTLPPEQLAQALRQLGIQAPALAQAPEPSTPSRLEWLQLGVGQQIRMVHVDDVVYLESDAKYTRVVTTEFDSLVRQSLKSLLDQLDESRFMRTHRSTVVNRRFIRAVHRHGEAMEIELRGRTERLKVSLPNHHLFRAM